MCTGVNLCATEKLDVSLQRIFTYLLHLCLALRRMWSSVSNPHPLTGDVCECAVSWEVFTGTKAAL